MSKKKRACKECGREMVLPSRGLCGKCLYHAMKAEKGEASKPQNRPVKPMPPVSNEAQEADGFASPESVVVVAVEFFERDSELLRKLVAEAEAERRSVEAQILVLLEGCLP